MKLSTRQQEILKAVINEHVRTAKPIGSKELVAGYEFKVSTATIRHEMSILEDAGLLKQPHTSAGRVPTDLGYRSYVKSFSEQGMIAAKTKRQEIQRRIKRMHQHYSALANETAELLAELTEQAAISQTEETSERSGLSNLIKLPELRDEQLAQAVAQIFDHPELLMKNLKNVKNSNDHTEVSVKGGQPVKVYIGYQAGLGRVPLSVLVSSYTVAGQQRHLVLLGPSRMAYGRNVALLSYMSKLLSRGNLPVVVAIVLPGILLINVL